MKTPSKKAIRQSKGIVTKKSLALVKKMQKQARKLRKAAIKDNNDVKLLALADRILEACGKLISDQKKLRDAETSAK